jgi:hypothetical protein
MIKIFVSQQLLVSQFDEFCMQDHKSKEFDINAAEISKYYFSVDRLLLNCDQKLSSCL